MNPINVPDPSEQKEYPPLPVIPGGEYQARLAKVSEKPPYGGEGDPQWMWEFRLFTPYADHPLFLWTSQKLGAFNDNGVVKKSKARLALEALLGRELQPKEVLNWEDLTGLSCVLMVTREPRKDATQETLRDGTGWRNKISAVVPLEGVTDIPRQRGLYAQEVSVPMTAHDHEIESRYESAVKLLRWGLPQLKETIGWIAASDEPWFKLTGEQKLKVVEYMEQELRDHDVPFEAGEQAEDEMDQAGLVSAGATSSGNKAPASAKHKIS